MILASRCVAVAAALLVFIDPAFAAEGVVEGVAGGFGAQAAAGIGIAIAALGGALGQGKIASSALDGIGRNPGAAGQMQTPMILGLVFVESLVIFSLVIALQLL